MSFGVLTNAFSEWNSLVSELLLYSESRDGEYKGRLTSVKLVRSK